MQINIVAEWEIEDEKLMVKQKNNNFQKIHKNLHKYPNMFQYNLKLKFNYHCLKLQNFQQIWCEQPCVFLDYVL